jgi:DNA primase
MLCAMINHNVLRTVAERYHQALPQRIRQYLNSRGISDAVIDDQMIGWSGRRITIPIRDTEGNVIGFRRGRDPESDLASPKMLSDVGAEPMLYGCENLAKNPHQIVICEGEYDRLVLESRGIQAVTSTAGAQTFLPAWIPLFANVKRIYICFDRDEAGESGARAIKAVLPDAVIIGLPDEVGPGGDITDYFVRLGRSVADFGIMLATAAARAEDDEAGGRDTPTATSQISETTTPSTSTCHDPRATRLKAKIRIAAVVSRFVELRPAGERLVGRCPFHEDNSPSFSVFPATGTYYCFGCGAHGDVISFVKQKWSQTYTEALEYLERLDLTDAA